MRDPPPMPKTTAKRSVAKVPKTAARKPAKKKIKIPATTKALKKMAETVKIEAKTTPLPVARDYISETISFVIKGKLTPIKPATLSQSAKKIKKPPGVPKSPPKKPAGKKKVTVSPPGIVKGIPNVKKGAPKKDCGESKKKAGSKVKAKSKETADDLKTKQTIEKLLKQAKCALKTKKKNKSPGDPSKGPKKRKLDSTDKSPKSEPKPPIKNEPPDDDDDGNRPKQQRPKKKMTTKPNVVLIKKRVGNKVTNSDKRSRKVKLFQFWNGPKRHRVASLNALAKVHCLYENETRSNLLDPISDGADVKGGDQKEFGVVKKMSEDEEEEEEENVEIPCTRTLRSVPGLRAVGKHWDMHDTSTSSSSSDDDEITLNPCHKPSSKKVKKESSPSAPKKKAAKKPTRRTAKNHELTMDLKDMVVRKRMASLNASAILAASYSVEKRASNNSSSLKSDSEIDSSDYFNTDNDEEAEDFAKAKSLKQEMTIKEEDCCGGGALEVVGPNGGAAAANGNKKVVIVNQDTDVTITGVYVNSTTRSTHHEGYCSIAGMQYRISATSHTQTAATAVATTETLLQSSSSTASASTAQDSSNSESLGSCKSYTPLDALSNMQPPPGPGIQHHQPMGPPQHHHHQHTQLQHPHQLSPNRRPHGCPSAFSAPHPTPPAGYAVVGDGRHHHQHLAQHPQAPSPGGGDASSRYVHGYYQPAGPLITVPPPHGHTQPPPLIPQTKTIPLTDIAPPDPSPLHQPPPPSSAGDSSDSEVIITSVTAAPTIKDSGPPLIQHNQQQQPQQPPPPSNNNNPAAYRYAQYPGAPPTFSYTFPHYYPTPPPPPPPPPQQSTYAALAPHHPDLCYTTGPYLHHKYQPTATFRRYLPVPSGAQYYPGGHHGDVYGAGAPGGGPPSQQVVSPPVPANTSSTSYPQPPSGPPATLMEAYPPTLVETYPHSAHYYPSYGPVPPPPPSCYTHSPATRSLPYMNATYQTCPCPMQSCPKNVHTGPLTGDSGKRSTKDNNNMMPLPPVALALPLEPASATGPPSPARGSAGMPPPPSPAGATYHQSGVVTPKTEDSGGDCEAPKKRKARIGKAMVRNHIQSTITNSHHSNTMLLMCNPCNKSDVVKREIESPKVHEKKEEEHEVGVALENLKTEPDKSITVTEGGMSSDDSDSKLVSPPSPQPAVITVAENVKMKNMKRKLSNDEAAVGVVGGKKIKVEGSYKDLIKRDTSGVKINNGKRKLIREGLLSDHCHKQSTVKKRRLLSSRSNNNKRHCKRLKLTPAKRTNNRDGAAKNKCVRQRRRRRRRGVDSVDKTIESVVVASDDIKCSRKNQNRKSTNNNNNNSLKNKNGARNLNVDSSCQNGGRVCSNNSRSKKTRRKSKSADEKDVVVPAAAQVVSRVSRRSVQAPRWSNGWTWEGEAYEAKVFLNSDETTVVRKCYPAMRHQEGDKMEVRDCVLLKAGPRKNDLPYVAKIAYLWENPDDGEMMMSLLWYYRPEHTDQGRLPSDQPDEVFASRHKDSNSVACIDDKCYVLTFHEYCRYRKKLRRLEEGLEDNLPCIPNPEPYPRTSRQPLHPLQVSPDMVFFCRRVYDFRQKRIVKNPS